MHASESFNIGTFQQAFSQDQESGRPKSAIALGGSHYALFYLIGTRRFIIFLLLLSLRVCSIPFYAGASLPVFAGREKFNKEL